MLAALTYPGLSSSQAQAEPIEFDPGIFSLVAAIVRFARDLGTTSAEADAARLIEASGGRLTDGVERQIGHRFV